MAQQKRSGLGVTARHARCGFTFIEIILSMVLAAIVIAGATAFRYVSALDAHRADVYAGAARVAVTLLEGWRETVTPDTYDPVSRYASQLSIGASATGPDVPLGFIALGMYEIVSDQVHYFATLSYREKTTSEPYLPYLLNVAVAWKVSAQAEDFLNFKLTSYK
jgi:prepilin-type N-terminal cleavage/methylation domain-containing protein